MDEYTTLKCANCGREYADDNELKFKLHEIRDLLMRIEPGGTVPAGECVDCDALVYPVKAPKFDYEAAAIRTKSPYCNIPPADLLHAVLGIVTEAGELTDALKRFIFYVPNDVCKVDKTNIAEELGDLMWYIALACNYLGVDFDTVQRQNIAKLQARYPDKFDSNHAQVRDLQAERKVLEVNHIGWETKLVDELNDLKDQRRQLTEQLRASSGLVKGVDWNMLRYQKLMLVAVIDCLMHVSPEASGGLDQGHVDALQGILHLIDTIQDDAAEELGETHVFGTGDDVYDACGTPVTDAVAAARYAAAQHATEIIEEKGKDETPVFDARCSGCWHKTIAHTCCHKGPEGWQCTRIAGHPGPCALLETEEG